MHSSTTAPGRSPGTKQRLPGGGYIEFYGSPVSSPLALIVSRDDFSLDDALTRSLVTFLTRHGWGVGRYVSAHDETRRVALLGTTRRLPKFWQGLIAGLVLLLRPRYWRALHPGYWSNARLISVRAAGLERALTMLKGREVSLLSRSAGARISTLIADQCDVRAVVALGYPFENPHEGPNPERYQHLASVRTPLLIIQGTRDEYGGAHEVDRYPLSPKASLLLVDTDHSMSMSDDAWHAVCTTILDFLTRPVSPGR